MDNTEPSQPIEKIKQDKAYSYAYAIKEGKANGIYLYCLENDKFYNYKDGYWNQLFEVEFLGRIEENIKEITRLAIGRRKQIIDNFRQLGRKSLSGFNWSHEINLKNGMVSPYDGIILDHDPIYYSTNRLPYIYDGSAICALWFKTLEEIFEGDGEKINILQEFFGYCLTRETKHHKALLLLGESRSGKSTIIQTLRQVIGNQNCASVPLKYISNAQYTAMLINKLVNIDTDVSSKAEQYEAEFKTITSGEPVAVNQKYVAAFDFVPYCKIVMAANIFPRITDHSSAFYNRLILIPCDRVFSYEEQNRDLPTQLLNELPGILNWSIEGLKRLTKRGKFEDLEFMRNAVAELEGENNPCNIFFNEHIEIDKGGYIEKGELFNHYKNWCDKNKHYPVSHIIFSRNLLKIFHKETRKLARGITGNRPYIWENLKYVENKSLEPIKTEIDWREPNIEKKQEDIKWD